MGFPESVKGRSSEGEKVGTREVKNERSSEGEKGRRWEREMVRK